VWKDHARCRYYKTTIRCERKKAEPKADYINDLENEE
jgi:hypothetical protein